MDPNESFDLLPPLGFEGVDRGFPGPEAPGA